MASRVFGVWTHKFATTQMLTCHGFMVHRFCHVTHLRPAVPHCRQDNTQGGGRGRGKGKGREREASQHTYHALIHH